jgi:hypothetical protein
VGTRSRAGRVTVPRPPVGPSTTSSGNGVDHSTLTDVAQRLGAEHVAVTDIYLPRWFPKRRTGGGASASLHPTVAGQLTPWPVPVCGVAAGSKLVTSKRKNSPVSHRVVP